MRVCFVPAGYKPIPPTKGGAVETIVNNFLLRNEEKHDMDITVLSVQDESAAELATKYHHTEFVFFSGNEKKDNLYYWILYRVLKKFFKIVLPDYMLKYRMMQYLEKEQERFDWIIFEGGEIECLKYYRNMIAPEKVIYHSHGEIRCTKGLDKALRAYIAVSDYIRGIWTQGVSRSQAISKSYVLKNGINQAGFQKVLSPEERKEMRSQFGFCETDIILVFIGRIIPEKGVVELLEAMTELPQKYKLLMVGSSNFGTKTKTSYEQKVNGMIEKMKDRISFTGFIHNDRIASYYQCGDISVVPSIFDDPAPLVIIEAMSAGLPIITTGSGGIKEYCDRECAIFVNRDKEISHNIAKAALEIGENYELRHKMGLHAKSRSRDFTDSAQYDAFLQLLNTIG